MSWHAIVTQERSNGTVNGALFVPPCLAFITLDPVLSGWVVVFFSTHRAVTDVVGGLT